MKKVFFLLIVILLIAIFLRTFLLDKIPASLFGDEIDVGYQAYSLLLTGRDLNNQFLPFYIKSLSEQRTPLYIYSAVPFVGVFGLNEWGVRLPAAFWGVVSVLGLFLLVRKQFSAQVGLIAAFLLSISPWHLQYSRVSFEVTELVSFIIFGTYFFIKGLEKPKYFLLAFFIFGLTPYIYSTALAFVPLWVVFLVIIYRDRFLSRHFLNQNKLLVLSIIFIVFVCTLPMLYSLYTGAAKERFGVISIFQDTVLLDKLHVARKGQDFYTPDGDRLRTNPLTEYIFHNKPLIFAQVFSQNYFEALSFDFLFGKGDPNFRQSIFEMGELYKFEIITILVGIFVLLTKFPLKVKLFIFGWLLMAPIPAALTDGGGRHATRLILELIPLVILSALGTSYIIENRKKFLFGLGFWVVVILAFFNITFYLHRYYIHYPVESWRWWHTGFKEAVNYMANNQDEYDTVIFNNSYEPSLIRYLFYTKYNPDLFHQEFTKDVPITNILPNINGFKLNNKVYFGYLTSQGRKNETLEAIMKPGMLFMVSARDDVDGEDLRTYQHGHYRILKTIVDPLGFPIFFIIEGK